MSHLHRRAFLQLAAAAPFVSAQTSARRPPNVVILFADDMGYSDLACYGNPTIRTPNLDRMAQEGIRFTSFYVAAPVCTPSRVGLLTGRYPVRAGLPGNLGPDSKGGLPLTEITLAQALKQRGYRTAMIGKWHLGHTPVEHLPTHRGFDSYFGLPYSNDMIPPWVKTERPLYLYRGDKTVEQVADQSNLTERYTDEAVEFLRAAAKQPFFLYLPSAMPHLPVSTSARFRGKSRAGLYGDVIETIDWSAGRILDTLRELKIDDNTLVVFASDNGPWHDLPPRMLAGGVEPWHTGSKGMLRGAKGSTYEGGVRVPCIMRWPGTIPAGQVTAEIASTLDLFPTCVGMAGGTLPAGRAYDGYDLLPFLQRKTPHSPRTRYFYHLGAELQGVRDGAWKLRVTKNSEPELFNLDADPAEMYNVYGRYPDVAARLRKLMDDFRVG